MKVFTVVVESGPGALPWSSYGMIWLQATGNIAPDLLRSTPMPLKLPRGFATWHANHDEGIAAEKDTYSARRLIRKQPGRARPRRRRNGNTG